MTEIIYDKPFKTYAEQVSLLRDKHGLTIKNSKFAETALRTFTYYDLVNGYKDSFMKNDKYLDGLTFEFIYLFAITDKDFQSIMFKYSTIVENSFKSKLAYVIAKHFGVHQNDYLAPNKYFNGNNKILFSDVNAACQYILNGQKLAPQPTKYYLEHHNHVPPWILLKNLSFSNSINLFQLLRRPEKEELVDSLIRSPKLSFDEKVNFLISALNIIRSFRNKIAHNLRFSAYKSYSHMLPPNIAIKLFPKSLLTWRDINKDKRGTNDIYAYLLSLFCLLEDPFLRLYCAREIEHVLTRGEQGKDHLKQSSDFYFEQTNLPKDIANRFKYFKMPK